MYEVLVTGASGFIGKRLCKAIKPKPKVIGRRSVKGYETVILDLAVDTPSPRLMKGVKTVFHLAAVTHDIRNSDDLRLHYLNLNVRGTKKLARAAADAGVQKFIYISSVKADVGSDDMDGEDADSTMNIYGQTKREAEQELASISQDSEMDFVILRPTLVYGPDVKGHLSVMLKAIEKGFFPPLPPTNSAKLMIHVDDLIEAMLIVAKDERANGKTFVVSDGHRYTAREVYEILSEVQGKKPKSWFVPEIVFLLLRRTHPFFREKIDKLFSNQASITNELSALGFQTNLRLQDIKKTSFL